MTEENKTKKYIFHVNGMHCASCVIMTESELKDLPNVTYAKSSLKNNTVEVTGDFGDKTPDQIAEELTVPLRPHGYTLSLEKEKRDMKWREFKIAIPITIGFIIFYIFLQKIGLVNLVNASEMTYGTAFVIGIIASLSTCMAVVGGLVLSLSATFAKDGDNKKPQILFHIGRLVSFFVLGGVIGILGSLFSLSAIWQLILNLLIALVMLILGLNLLDVFHFTKKLMPGMPKFVSRRALAVSKLNHTLTPLLAGLATFFLPCGFTQSMQIYTLQSGSFMEGAFTMFAFALGTLPVLALLSFSSLSIKDNKNLGIFFKTAGLVVILFAIFNLINGMVVAGIISPVFNF